MLLSSFKPVVCCLPSSSRSRLTPVDATPASNLRLNSHVSSFSHQNIQYETPMIISRRDIMSVMWLAASGLFTPMAKPAKALELEEANLKKSPFSQFLEAIKDKVGLSMPKSDVDDNELKTGAETRELSKLKTEGDDV
ncbi:unnamed protein product [Cuscuta europaea]|uniref:Uncharacterized protein n=1 Tax=Cuscuta europaea TaxID=41803 RepID=A0A9P1ELB2_CUSEU|nr:unnamed protein product [Cuscuta europaea]